MPFEPQFKQLHKEQKENGTIWSPSKLINRLGKEINNEESIFYWCWKNDIPVFSPALTDGEIGDILVDHFVHEGDGFILDIAQDYKRLNDIAISSVKTGVITFGGGVIKQRIARPGESKSKGYRSIVLYRKGDKAFFVYGFPKSDLGNIRDDEQEQFKKAAKSILALSDDHIRQLIENGHFEEVKKDG
jgi:hypothetical protein